MEILRFFILVSIGGLIGYITNKIAIKMLFRPIKPRRFLWFTIQGVFPKRKNAMALSLADTIEEELLSKDAIIDQLYDGEHLEIIKKRLIKVLKDGIKKSIPPMAQAFLGNIDEMIDSFLAKKGDALFQQLMDEFKHASFEQLDIHAMVKERIDALDFVEFERIIFGLMNKELKHIEIIGLFLGMVIGAIQYVVTIII